MGISHMKHARADYNRIQDPAGKIPDDEPVFLVRAQDRFSGTIVRVYRMLLLLAGIIGPIADALADHADAMDAWPKKKDPDLPAAD
jgi:hypothetical protein